MKRLVLSLTLLTSLATMAQESIPSFETVVEDVIFNTSTRVIIDEKTIKESRSPNIVTLLASQANVTITNTPFQPNSIYIRGGDASHLLILIDGVPFYDASTSQRTLDLNSLDIKSVRRIEIIKGSQTVLYGGQALSGVIKIDTIPQDMAIKTTWHGRLGTQGLQEFSAIHTDLFSEDQGFIVRGHGAWRKSESPVLDSTKTYDRNNWNAEGTYVFKGATEGHIKANFLQDWNLSPTTAGPYLIMDTDNFEIFTRQLGVSSLLRFKELPWSPRLAMSGQNSLKTYEQPAIPPMIPQTNDHYGANLHTIRLDVSPYKGDQVAVTAGLSYVYEDIAFRKLGVESANRFSEQQGLFAKFDYDVTADITLTVGGRLEKWDHNDPYTSHHIGLSLYKNTKVEYSVGYKFPSLFQLYSSYGNPSLQPEHVNQYSLSQDFVISDNQQASLTLFRSHFTNLILAQGAPPNTKYANVNTSEVTGAEIVYTLRPTDSSSLLLTYGYQEPRDLDNNRWLQRRPLVSGSVRYLQSWEKHSGSVELMGSGEKLDRASGTRYVSLPGHMIANASYSYKFNDKLNTYVRLNNILDYRYQETYTYYTEGFSGFVGAEYSF